MAGKPFIGFQTQAQSGQPHEYIELERQRQLDIQSATDTAVAASAAATAAQTTADAAVSDGGYQIFTSSGTWTKPSGLNFIVVECWAAGGGGGGTTATGAGENSVGSGGGGGGYVSRVFAEAALDATETVTIGAKGVGVSGADGTDGGDSSFTYGVFTMTAGGGGGGNKGIATAGDFTIIGGSFGTAAGATINVLGHGGGTGHVNMGTTFSLGGAGASGTKGIGGNQTLQRIGSTSGSSGDDATGYGAGGGGALAGVSLSARIGGDGTAGLIIITEYLNSN